MPNNLSLQPQCSACTGSLGRDSESGSLRLSPQAQAVRLGGPQPLAPGTSLWCGDHGDGKYDVCVKQNLLNTLLTCWGWPVATVLPMCVAVQCHGSVLSACLNQLFLLWASQFCWLRKSALRGACLHASGGIMALECNVNTGSTAFRGFSGEYLQGQLQSVTASTCTSFTQLESSPHLNSTNSPSWGPHSGNLPLALAVKGQQNSFAFAKRGDGATLTYSAQSAK